MCAMRGELLIDALKIAIFAILGGIFYSFRYTMSSGLKIGSHFKVAIDKKR